DGRRVRLRLDDPVGRSSLRGTRLQSRPPQGFPSGQRGRAVNPLAQPSEVRILLPALQIVSLGFRTDLMVLALGGSETEHGAWGIDSVDGTIGAESDLVREGFELSRDTVLTATAIRPPSRGVNAELRALAGDEDWRQALDLRIACLPDDEHYTEPFVRAHLAGSRALCEQGSATWFGAFEH